MGKVLNFPLQKFFHNMFEDLRKKQNDMTKKKIDFLYNEAYKYFLDVYLDRIAKQQILDLPPFFYTTGKVICEEAKSQAEQVMLDVIADGRINHCYSKRMKQVRNCQICR